jgi:transposase InsO family protein
MDRVLGRLKWQYCLVYLDDVLVHSRTFEEHLSRLDSVLSAISSSGLTLNPKKCRICRREALYLGHRVSHSGITPDPQKTESVRSYPTPPNVKAVRQFLGMASYYRRFVKDFARISVPLTSLLKKDASWTWGSEQNQAFVTLIESLTSAPVLAHFDESADVVLRTDASLLGMGAVLCQVRDGREHVVSYLSRQLLDNEKRWHSNELECGAVVWATKKLRPYLYDRHFTIETDNSAVVWLFKKQNPEGKFARWILDLSEYDFAIRHTSGSANKVADTLSRIQPEECGTAVATQVVEAESHSRDPDDRVHSISNLFLLVAPKIPSLSSLTAPVSHLELSFAQSADPTFGPIISSLSNCSGPDPNLLLQYRLVKGVLYRKSTRTGRRWLLAVPQYLRRDVIASCHNDVTAGHEGERKTYWRVRNRFWWPGMQKMTRQFVSGCIPCQLRKIPRRLPTGELQPIPAPTRPFGQWGIDHQGPFMVSDGGNRHIVVAVCYTTRLVVARAVPDVGSATTQRFVEEEILFRFGSPDAIVSDQGSSFTSKSWSCFLEQHGIRRILATAERPQTNGLVERANAVLTDRMAHQLKSDLRWDEGVPAAVFAINTGIHFATRTSPFELVYGTQVRLPVENRFPWPSDEENPSHEANRIQASGELQTSQDRSKLNHDHRHRPADTYLPGDLVLVRRKQSRPGSNAKFQPRYIGPFQVVRPVGPLTYQVEDPPATRTKTRWRVLNAHVAQMKLFRPGSNALIQGQTSLADLGGLHGVELQKSRDIAPPSATGRPRRNRKPPDFLQAGLPLPPKEETGSRPAK